MRLASRNHNEVQNLEWMGCERSSKTSRAEFFFHAALISSCCFNFLQNELKERNFESFLHFG